MLFRYIDELYRQNKIKFMKERKVVEMYHIAGKDHRYEKGINNDLFVYIHNYEYPQQKYLLNHNFENVNGYNIIRIKDIIGTNEFHNTVVQLPTNIIYKSGKIKRNNI